MLSNQVPTGVRVLHNSDILPGSFIKDLPRDIAHKEIETVFLNRLCKEFFASFQQHPFGLV